MRAFLLLALCVSLISTEAYAKKRRKRKRNQSFIEKHTKRGYGMAGCGLGAAIFGADNSQGTQILASVTNFVGSSNNLFAYSSQTSNCNAKGVFSVHHRRRSAKDFIVGNRAFLQKEIARQSGETLISLSEVMGCQDTRAVNRVLNQNYKMIFTQGKRVEDQILRTIDNSGLNCLI